MTVEPSSPLVSVVSVCYNESPERIERTLASIEAQTYPRVEKILADGGSPPATTRALQQHCRPEDRFVSQEDDGIYDAMNKAVEHATGEFVIFMNIGDTFADATVVARLVACVARNPECAFVYGDYWRVDGGSRVLVRVPTQASRFGLYHTSICHQSIMARRWLFANGYRFDTSYPLFADQHWILSVMKHRGVHAGIPVCEFEWGGACSDLTLLDQEWARFRRERYTPAERCVFSVGRFWLRALGRIRTRNTALPVFMRHDGTRDTPPHH